MNTKVVKDFIERAVKSFGAGYVAVVAASGVEYDHLLTEEAFKGGVVAAFIFAVVNLGLYKFGPNPGEISVVKEDGS